MFSSVSGWNSDLSTYCLHPTKNYRRSNTKSVSKTQPLSFCCCDSERLVDQTLESAAVRQHRAPSSWPKVKCKHTFNRGLSCYSCCSSLCVRHPEGYYLFRTDPYSEHSCGRCPFSAPHGKKNSRLPEYQLKRKKTLQTEAVGADDGQTE